MSLGEFYDSYYGVVFVCGMSGDRCLEVLGEGEY